MAKNYYKILGVEKGISGDDLRKKYLELAKKHHPDTNKTPGSEEKFKEIQEAYEAIKDGKADRPPDPGGPFGFDFGGFNNGGPIDIGQFDFYQPRQSLINPDVEKEVEIEFLTSCIGGEVAIKYEYDDQCATCQQHYEKHKDFKYDKCTVCNGHGATIRRNSFMTMRVTCGHCNGSGKSISCDKCGGSRYEKRHKTINIRVPAGIEHMTVLRVSSCGNFNYQTMSPGNLYIRIMVRSDAKFRRDGLSIFSNLNIDYLECILGAEIEADTIHGKVKIEIPMYCQNGSVITSNSNGIKLVDKNIYGNHYFTISVAIPKTVSAKDKKYLQKIRNNNKK